MNKLNALLRRVNIIFFDENIITKIEVVIIQHKQLKYDI